MKKITVVVTNDEERRRAEYVAAHWQEISYELNGIYSAPKQAIDAHPDMKIHFGELHEKD